MAATTRAPPLGPRAANGTSREPREPREHQSTAVIAPEAAEPPAKVGPHPGHITCASQYTSESTLRAHLRSLATSSAASPNAAAITTANTTISAAATNTTPSSASNSGNHPPPGVKAATLPIDPAREDTYRLQGVQLIDNVRERVQLPLRTFDTACVYYHRFRLGFHDAEYAYQDAALASLFVACKVEDTIKKSRDILAAAYNVKNPDKPAAPDDKIFEASGKIIIGLERLILETIGFDFRTRYPQKLLAKTIRAVLSPNSSSSSTASAPKAFFATAYAMSIDMYKTFVPIKRTTFAMVSAITELTALMLSPSYHRHSGEEDEGAEKSSKRRRTGETEGEKEEEKGSGERSEHEDDGEDDIVKKFRAFSQRKHGHGGRPAVLETMLDLLDLYVQHHKSTRLGATFDINHFMDIKIHLNKELESSSLSRHLGHCPRCEFASASASVSAPAADLASVGKPQASQGTGTGSGTLAASRSAGATMRFVFDPETARAERETADAFFKEEFEEYEIEIDEPIPPPPPAAPHAPRREREEGSGGGGGGGGGRGRRFHGGGGGHPRDRWSGGGGGGGGGGGYRGDRRRGRRH